MSPAELLSRSRALRLLLAFVGGALCALTVPPFGWWPLAIPGIALLNLAAVGSRRRRTRFAVTLLWGLALYVPSLWWMTAFSLPGGIFVAVLESTITALCVVALVGRRQGLPAIPGIISALMIAEALRSLWPFGGLPLSGLDLGQAAGWFAPLVGWGGRLLLVGAIATLGGVCAAFISSAGSIRRNSVLVGALAFVTAAVCVAPVLERATIADHTTASASVTVVQGGGPRGLLASSANAQRTFQAHVDATTARPRNVPTDLILWPENTVDTKEFTSSERAAVLRKLVAGADGAYLSVGITEDGGAKEFLNAQVLISPTGEVVDRYDKVRRVPFGEYFPLRSTIEGLGLAELPSRDARPGTTTGILKSPDHTYGVLISYEGFFDDRSRNAVRDGAEVILIPTNASSYTTSQLPTQQVAAAQLRALETNRDVIQAGPTGYSAFIAADGKVRVRTVLGERAVFTAAYTPRFGLTPYARWNDLPSLLLAGLLWLGSLVGSVQRSRVRSTSQAK